MVLVRKAFRLRCQTKEGKLVWEPLEVPPLALLRLQPPNEPGTRAPLLVSSPETAVENTLALESEDSSCRLS